jgi:hypothetical protein
MRGFFCLVMAAGNSSAEEREMVKKTTKLRAWTKDDVRRLKTLARDGTETTVIARRLKRSYAATRQKASTLGVPLGARSKKKRKA